MLHNMAPMAGGIADAEKNRPVELARSRQRVGTPRVPIHRIMGMLAEIGTCLINEAIGLRFSVLHGALHRKRFGSCGYFMQIRSALCSSFTTRRYLRPSLSPTAGCRDPS